MKVECWEVNAFFILVMTKKVVVEERMDSKINYISNPVYSCVASLL